MLNFTTEHLHSVCMQQQCCSDCCLAPSGHRSQSVPARTPLPQACPRTLLGRNNACTQSIWHPCCPVSCWLPTPNVNTPEWAKHSRIQTRKEAVLSRSSGAVASHILFMCPVATQSLFQEPCHHLCLNTPLVYNLREDLTQHNQYDHHATLQPLLLPSRASSRCPF